MKITKYGHCCMIIEPKEGVRIMTDPGTFTTGQNGATNITAIVITHEHGDHFHIESVKEVLKNNPNAAIITNTAVGKLLEAEGIPHTKVEDTESTSIEGISIKGFGQKHAEIYGDYGQVQNTGYMIDNLCYPGDGFAHPDMPVDILALPVAGPWMKIKECIDYAKEVKPRICFPVHDAIISPSSSFVYTMIEKFLNESNISMKKLELEKEEEI